MKTLGQLRALALLQRVSFPRPCRRGLPPRGSGTHGVRRAKGVPSDGWRNFGLGGRSSGARRLGTLGEEDFKDLSSAFYYILFLSFFINKLYLRCFQGIACPAAP